MSDFKSSPHQTPMEVTFGDASEDAHQITGSLTVHGPISSSYGATFVGNVIAGSLSISGSTDFGAALSSSGQIQGHSLAIQDGAIITGSTVLHGPLSSSYDAIFDSSVQAGALTVSGSTVISGSLTVQTGTARFEHLVSSSFGFQAPQHYIAPPRDLADIDTVGQFQGTNTDFSGSWIAGGTRSGQVTYTLGVALSASGDGSWGFTGLANDGSVFTEKDNVIINVVEGSNYGGVGGGTLGGADLSFGVPYMVTYGGNYYACFFQFTNNLGTPIAADQTFKINFTFI